MLTRLCHVSRTRNRLWRRIPWDLFHHSHRCRRKNHLPRFDQPFIPVRVNVFVCLSSSIIFWTDATSVFGSSSCHLLIVVETSFWTDVGDMFERSKMFEILVVKVVTKKLSVAFTRKKSRVKVCVLCCATVFYPNHVWRHEVSAKVLAIFAWLLRIHCGIFYSLIQQCCDSNFTRTFNFSVSW